MLKCIIQLCLMHIAERKHVNQHFWLGFQLVNASVYILV